MKGRLKSYLGILIMTIAVALAGCEGKDGDPGPQGETGVGEKGDRGDKGDPGDDGNDGSNGENGVGFNESTALGNIELTIQGVTPEGNAFTKDINFKYAFPELKFSSVYNTGTGTFSKIDLRLVRLSYPLSFVPSADPENDEDEEQYRKSYVDLDLAIEFNNGALTKSYIDDFNIETEITQGFKYFEFADVSNYDGLEYSNFQITNYSYTPANGKLTFDFSFTLNDTSFGSFNGYNSTGNAATITGKVDVIVYETMDMGARIKQADSRAEVEEAYHRYSN